MMVDNPVGDKGKTAGDIVAGAGGGAPEKGARLKGGAGGGRGGGGEGRDRGKATARNVTARQVANRVYKESGLRGFYRGFGISVLQFAPTSAVSTHGVTYAFLLAYGAARGRKKRHFDILYVEVFFFDGRYEWFLLLSTILDFSTAAVCITRTTGPAASIFCFCCVKLRNVLQLCCMEVGELCFVCSLSFRVWLPLARE